VGSDDVSGGDRDLVSSDDGWADSGARHKVPDKRVILLMIGHMFVNSGMIVIIFGAILTLRGHNIEFIGNKLY
jgi:hypothetical protein